MVSTRSGGAKKTQSQGSIHLRSSKRKRDDKEIQTAQAASKKRPASKECNEEQGESQVSIDMNRPEQLHEREQAVGDAVADDEVGVAESSDDDSAEEETGEPQTEGGAGRDEEGREEVQIGETEAGSAGVGEREGANQTQIEGGGIRQEEVGETGRETEECVGSGRVEEETGQLEAGDGSCGAGERERERQVEAGEAGEQRVAIEAGELQAVEEEAAEEEAAEKEVGGVGENFNPDVVVGDVLRELGGADQDESAEKGGEEDVEMAIGEAVADQQVHGEVAFTPQNNLRTHMDVHGETKVPRFAVRSSISGSFAAFKKLLKKLKFEESFRNSIFGHLWELNSNAIFAPKLVHGLRERAIVCGKKKELWVNFNGLPVRFGLREFALMTGLQCHSFPSDEFITGEVAKRGEALWFSITNEGKQKSVTAEQLLEQIETSTTISRPHKFRLCLAWFAHTILCAKDKRTSVPKKYVHLASRPNTYFNEYPWGRESFDQTIKYLLIQSVDKKDFTLYGFPWAFIAWAYEAIPSLRHGEFPELPTEPRMIRWMSDKQERECDQLFRNADNPVVTPCLVPTPSEMEKDFMKKFVPYEDVEDEVIDRLTEKLDGVSRLTLAVQIPVDGQEDGSRVNAVGALRDRGDGGDFSEGRLNDCADVEVPVQDVAAEHEVARRVSFSAFGGGGGHNRGFERSFGSVGDGGEGTSRSHYCCQCKLCQECKEQRDKEKQMFNDMKEVLDSLLQWTKQQPRRTVYPARTQISPYVQSIKRRARMVKNRKTTPVAKKVREIVHEEVQEQVEAEFEERLPVNIYRHVDPAKKKAFDAYMRSRKKQKIIVMGHEYDQPEFRLITTMSEWLESQHVDVILALMRIRHKEFTSHYDPSDVILDMNFCSVIAGSYMDLEKEAEKEGISLAAYMKVMPTAQGLVDYALGKTPYPGGRRWDGVKRIFTIMNIIKKHYVTVVFLVEEGRIEVYDCNIGVFDEDTFAPYMFPITVMFPRLLRDCGKFNHLPDEILKQEMWPYERLKGLPHNDTGTACGGYSLMYIEHLLTNTPMTELSDNTMEDCRYRWAVDVFHEKMSP